MADRTAARTRQAPDTDTPDVIRNVALVGCSAAGKTTLAESLAVASGALGRAGRVAEGTTVSDFDELEQRHRRSVQLAVLPLAWNGIKINLIDTPGHPDFDAELRAGLHAADAAIFVVSATDPITATTRALWRECDEEAIPRAIAVSKLDIARHSFDDMLEQCHDAFGLGPDTVRALFYPVFDGDRPIGSTGLLTGRSYGEPGPCPVSPAARESLVEAISGQDDTLMERFVAGEQLDPASLQDGLSREILSCAIHPAVPVTESGVGAVELLELVTTGFPAPTHRGRGAPACDPAAPLAAQIVRVTADAYVGRISLVRVYSGTIRPDTVVELTGGERHSRERVPGLTSPFGSQQRPVGEAVAGDLVCVGKLAAAQAGDVLHEPGRPVELTRWPVPTPLLPVAVEAHSRTDDDKLSQALSRLAAEDPAVRVEQNPDTHQVVLWCTGEAHAELVVDRLRHRHGVQVDLVEHRVALRETFAAPATGHGRLVKQSGGHGQYAVCDLEIEPLPAGSGVVFDERVVGARCRASSSRRWRRGCARRPPGGS